MNIKKILLLLLVIGVVIFGYFMLRSRNWWESPSASVGRELEEREMPVEAPASPYPGIDNLYEAVEARHLPAARYWLDQGANINQQFTRARVTPLMVAAREGDQKMVELLLQRGANPNMTNSAGQTAADISWKQRHRTGEVSLYTDITLDLERAGARRRQTGDE